MLVRNAMVSWFKQPNDSNVTKRKVPLLQRYMLTCHCRKEEQKQKEEPKQKKDDEPTVVDGIPVNTANNPAGATANKTALEDHKGIVAAMTEV